MVYDVKGHYVGDMHWRHDWDFDEGEEIELERGGVIVQVAECVGRQEQDLSELLDRRAKEKEQRQQRTVSTPTGRLVSGHTPSALKDHFHTRHRPLTAILGMPTGHHGRAVIPRESPFELRQRAEQMANTDSDPRPAKRRKYDITPPSKTGYAQHLFGATLTLSAVPVSSVPPRCLASQTQNAQPEVSTNAREAGTTERMRDDREQKPVGFEERALSGLSAFPQSGFPSRGETGGFSGKLSESERKSSQPQENIGTRSEFVEPGTSKVDNCERTINPRMSTKTTSDLVTSHFTIPDGQHFTNEHVYQTKISAVKPGVERHPAVSLSHGASASQAIVLDDESDSDAPESANLPQQIHGKEKEEEKKASQCKLSEAVPPPSDKTLPRKSVIAHVEDYFNGERMELRLKPRPKRGLLLLTEKKLTAKQTNMPLESTQSDPTSLEPSAFIGATRLLIGNRPPSVGIANDSPNDSNDSFASELAIAHRSSTITSSNLISSAQGIANQIPREAKDAAKGDGILDSCSRGEEAQNLPESSAPALDLETTPEPANSPKEIEQSSSSPPQRRRGLRASNRRLHHPEDSSDERELSRAPSSPDFSAKPKRENPVNKSKDNKKGGSARPVRPKREIKKIASVEESGGCGGFQASSRPRLTKLSKSVRSRELIGYIPTSTPVPVNPLLTSVTSSPTFAEEKQHSSQMTSIVDETAENSILAASANRVVRSASPINQSPEPNKIGPTNNLVLHKNSIGGPTLESVLPKTVPGKPIHLIEEPASEHTNCGSPTGPATNVNASNCRDNEEELSSITAEPCDGGQATSFTPTTSLLMAGHITCNNQAEVQSPTGKMQSASKGGMSTLDANQAFPKVLSVSAQPSVSNFTAANGGTGINRPRIPNPATRGRKAALKSDAIGLVPRPVLPPELPSFAMRSTGSGWAGQPVAEERSKRKMMFPGFVSARGGGPWSREAHDLLETGRPAG